MSYSEQTSFEKFKAVLKKAVSFNSQPTEEDFPELPDVLVWFRFFLALSYGLFLGYRDARSGMKDAATLSSAGVLQALNLIAFFPVMYCRLYLGTDKETFGTQIIFSGLINALALTLLIWIYFFTLNHPDAEAKLMTYLIQSAASSPDMSSDIGDESATAETNIPLEDSEF